MYFGFRVRVSIGGRGSFLGSFRGRSSFWLGPGTRLDPFCLSPSIIYFFFNPEKGNAKIKTEALKRVIQQILNGEKMPSLLMVVIKFLMPLQDHTIKKLLLIFWEICPKTGSDGKLLHEMILVCDAYRKVRELISP